MREKIRLSLNRNAKANLQNTFTTSWLDDRLDLKVQDIVQSFFGFWHGISEFFPLTQSREITQMNLMQSMARPTVGISKKGLLTFMVGIFFGMTVTYMLSYVSIMHPRITTPSGGVRTISGGFIPDSPHSHGETDELSGPQHSVNWADKHSHSHMGTYLRPFLRKCVPCCLNITVLYSWLFPMPYFELKLYWELDHLKMLSCRQKKKMSSECFFCCFHS